MAMDELDPYTSVVIPEEAVFLDAETPGTYDAVSNVVSAGLVADSYEKFALLSGIVLLPLLDSET